MMSFRLGALMLMDGPRRDPAMRSLFYGLVGRSILVNGIPE